MTKNRVILAGIMAIVFLVVTALQLAIVELGREWVEQGGVWRILAVLANARAKDEGHGLFSWGFFAAIVAYLLIKWRFPDWTSKGGDVFGPSSWQRIENILTIMAVLMAVLVGIIVWMRLN